jgi:hypothetical protein
MQDTVRCRDCAPRRFEACVLLAAGFLLLSCTPDSTAPATDQRATAAPEAPGEGEAVEPPEAESTTPISDPGPPIASDCSGAAVVDAEGPGGCAHEPCGGNLVGTWRQVGVCGDYRDFASEPFPCDVRWPDDNDALTTLTFGADGRFEVAYSGLVCPPDVTLPAECAANTLNGCSSFDYFAPYGTTECTTQPDGNCLCSTPPFAFNPLRRSGSYTSAGSTVTATVDQVEGLAASQSDPDEPAEPIEDTPSPPNYCVTGDTLTLGGSDGIVQRFRRMNP